MEDVNLGSALNDVCEVSPVPLSDETVSTECCQGSTILRLMCL